MKKIYLLTLTLCSLFTIPATVNAQLGQLWGVTESGGTSGNGVLFYFDAGNGKDSIVYNFPSGANPEGTPIQATNGNVYGVTQAGGVNSKGSVWEFNTSTWIFTTLASFTGTNGQSPNCTLMQSKYDGNLYGTTSGGGTGNGVIFQCNINTGVLTAEFNFLGGTNGKLPGSGLVEGATGTLYGTTEEGGATGAGNLYKFVISTSTYTNLHSFTLANDGSTPWAAPFFNQADNTLYGTTQAGGTTSNGTIYKYLVGAGTFSAIENFPSPGAASRGSVYVNGTEIFGMTFEGGVNSDGDIYDIQTSGTGYTDLYDFTTSGAGGNTPTGNFCYASDGNLYGITSAGGANNKGALFKSTTAGVVTNLVYFNGPNGEYPNHNASVMELFSNNIKETDPGCSSVTLTAMPRGYVGALNYSWSTGATTSSVSGLGTGPYSVTVTSAVTGISITTSYTVAASTFTVTPSVTNVTCNGDNNGAVMLTPSTMTGPFTFSWSNGNTNGGLMNVAPGTYTCTATDNSGCTATASVTVTQPAALTATATGAGSICNGSGASLSATVTGGTPGYSYLWTPTTGISTPSAQSVTATPTTTTTYTVTVYDLNGCGASSTAVVTVNPTPSAPSAGGTSSICSGNTISLTASTVAGATYSWTGPNSFSSTSQNPTIANCVTADGGTYSVVAISSGCSSAVATTSVTVNATPATPTVGSNSPVCSGNALNLTSTTIAGASYLWSGPNSFSAPVQNPTISSAVIANAGTYSVTVTVNGCASTGTGSVTVNATPAAPTVGSNSPVCTGNTISLTASSAGGATFAWTGPNSFSSTNQNPTVSNSTTADGGNYSVTATVSGCTSSAGVVDVTVNTTPSAPTAGSNSPVCAGSAINLTASTIASASYSWTGPGSYNTATQDPSISSATVGDAGTYSVTATVSGCTSSAGTVNVTVNALPAAPTAGSNTPVCTGNPINLTASTIAGATYSWTGPNSYSASTQTPTISSASNNNGGTYSVTATVSGCTGPAGTTNVTVNTTPSAPTASSNSPVCTGATLNLTASNIASATYSWTGPNTYSSSNQNPSESSIGTADAGTYSVTATVSGCTSAAGTVAVTVNTTPSAPTAGSNSPVCLGSAINLTASTIASATYSWSGPSYTSTNQSPTISSATSGNAGTYSVTATVSGCTGPAGTTNVTVNTLPTVSITAGHSAICTGNGTLLSGNGASNYTWAPATALTATSGGSVTANPTSTITYTVTGTDGNGCVNTGTQVITVNSLPSVTANATSTNICEGSNTALVGGGATSYSWIPSTALSSTTGSFVTATPTANVTYTVTGTDGNGCVNTASVAINVDAPLVAVTSTNASCHSVCNGTAQATGSSGTAPYTYTWSNSTTDALAIDLCAGSYTVTLKDNQGCTNAKSVSISQPSPITVSMTPVATTCGSANGQAIAVPSGGSSPYTYTWSTTPAQTTQTAVTLAAGNYTVDVTDANGCTGTGTVNIAGSSAIAITATVTPSSCSKSDGIITAGVTGGTSPYIYSWNNGCDTIKDSGLAAGIYILTVTDKNGCSSFRAVNVSDAASPTVTVTSQNNIPCNGGSSGEIGVSVSGGTLPYTYNWSNSATTASISGLSAGPYQVTVTDGAGCITVQTITITQPAALDVTPASVQANCGLNDGSASITVKGGTTPYTYAWSTGGTTSGITAVGVGTYSVTITDGDGCQVISNVSVSNAAGPLVTVDSVTNVNCANVTLGGVVRITANGGTPPYTYLWSDGSTNGIDSSLAPGNYAVTVTDQSGCSGSANATVAYIQPETISICMATVDPATNYNNLLWDGSPLPTIKQYNIYKETTSPGVFGLIGSVPVGNNTYIDSLSDARIRSWRYEISQVDSCGSESKLSAPFKTMHLTVNLGASNSVNLIWDNFEGITFGYYIVYRDSVVGVAKDSIGYVTNNGTFTFTDYPSTNTNWYYHMGIANSAPCEPRIKPHSINYNASKSNTGNIFFSGPTGTPTITAQASTVDIYPNPNTGQFTVSMSLKTEQEVNVKIYDALGQLLQTENYGALQGKVNKQFNLSSYPKGVYMMQVITADGAKYKKIILQ